MKSATGKKSATGTPLSVIVKPLRTLRRFVFGDIRVLRTGTRLQLAFGEAARTHEAHDDAPAAAKPAKADKAEKHARRAVPAQAVAESAAEAEFRQMRHELSIFLNGAKNRKALRHLAFFEGVMAKRGAGALESVSFDTLKKAHTQLNLLLNIAPSRTLRVLSSKMLVALVAREGEGEVQILDNRKTDFMPSNLPA